MHWFGESLALSNFSEPLPWCSCTSHQKSPLLGRPAGMPSQCLMLSSNWRFEAFTPPPLTHSWRLPVSQIHCADESSDSTRDEYDKRNALWLWNCNNHCCENMAPSLLQSMRSGLSCCWGLLQTCSVVSAALDVSCRPAETSQQLQYLTILMVNVVAFWMHLHNRRRFLEYLRMLLLSLSAHC